MSLPYEGPACSFCGGEHDVDRCSEIAKMSRVKSGTYILLVDHRISHERAIELLRHCRQELLRDGLITDQEYSALVTYGCEDKDAELAHLRKALAMATSTLADIHDGNLVSPHASAARTLKEIQDLR